MARALLLLTVVLVGCGDDEPSFEPRTRGGRGEASETEAPSAPAAPTQSVLIDRFREQVARTDPAVRLRPVGGWRVEGRREGEVFNEVNLENASHECATAPASCDDTLATYARVFLGRGLNDPTPENLRLALTGQTILERQIPEALAWTEPFAGDLRTVFVADFGDAIATLRPDDLETMGLDEDAARERALANMRDAFGPIRHELFLPEGRVWKVNTATGGIASDSHDNARLILHELWAPIREQVRGELLVAAPTRDIVLFTGTEEPQGLRGIRYLATEMWHGEPHPVSPQIVRWATDGWEPIEP